MLAADKKSVDREKEREKKSLLVEQAAFFEFTLLVRSFHRSAYASLKLSKQSTD